MALFKSNNSGRRLQLLTNLASISRMDTGQLKFRDRYRTNQCQCRKQIQPPHSTRPQLLKATTCQSCFLGWSKTAILSRSASLSIPMQQRSRRLNCRTRFSPPSSPRKKLPTIIYRRSSLTYLVLQQLRSSLTHLVLQQLRSSLTHLVLKQLRPRTKVRRPPILFRTYLTCEWTAVQRTVPWCK